MSSPAPFDRARLRRHRDRAAARYPDHDFLIRLTVKDMLDRASLVTHDFNRALALGGGGIVGELLPESPMAEKIGWLAESDLSPAMAARAAGPAFACDEERLPLAEDSLDLILAPLSLHWTNDLPGALIQIRRALKPDGLFIGSMFASGSLGELRECLLTAEAEITGGAARRVAPFGDVRDLGGLLQRAGFAMPVSDIDRHTIEYAEPARLFADLRGMGETAAVTDAAPSLSRKVLGRTLDLYAERYATLDGKLPVSVTIAHLSGWAPSENQPQPKRPGSATVKLADALGVKEKSAGEKAGE